MGDVTYSELVERFGKDTAVGLLRCIERLASIRDDIIAFDQDTRFQRALEALNETHGA